MAEQEDLGRFQNEARSYQCVLDKEKDMCKNFEIDLIGALEKLNDECKADVAEALTDLKFGLAGLVIQGSANVYGKKVDYVHNLTYDVYERLQMECRSKNKQINTNDADAGRENKDIGEYICCDFNEERSLKKDSTLEKNQLTHMPLALIPLDADDKGNEMIMSTKNEEMCNPLDLCIKRFRGNCIDVVLLHQYSEQIENTLSTSNGTAINGHHLSDLSDSDSDIGLPINDDPPCHDHQPLDLDLGNEELVGRVPERQHVEEHHTKCVGDSKNSNSPKKKCKAVVCLDPHEPQVKLEKKPGLRKRVLPVKYETSSVTKSPKYSKKRKRLYSPAREDESASQENLKVKVEPFWEYFEKTKSQRREEKERKLREKRPSDDLPEVNGGIEDESEDDHCNEDFDQGDELDLNYEEPNNNNQEEPPESLVENADFVSLTPATENPCKTLAFQLKQQKMNAANFLKTTEISQRVKKWNEQVNVLLEEEKTRKNFDPFKCQQEILNRFTHVGEVIPFQKIVRGKEKWDISRYLICSLFLANHSNIEIQEKEDVKFKLLSRQLREDITENFI